MFSCISCVSKVIPIVHVFPVCEKGLIVDVERFLLDKFMIVLVCKSL